MHVGYGEMRPSSLRSALAMTHRFVARRSDLRGRKVLCAKAGLIPDEPARALAGGGAMVVGDAAGLVNPVTGGGIAYALLSGELAGRTAAEAVNRGRTGPGALEHYPRRLRMTPHYAWLKTMASWRRRLDRPGPAAQPAAYGRMLKRYFGFFHALRPVAEMLLG